MKLFTLGFALAAVAAAPAIAAAQGNSDHSPGYEMQRYGSVPGHPGASGYAPGHDRDGFHRDETTGFNRDRDFDRDDVRRDHRHFDRDDFRRGDRDFDRDDMRRY